MVLYRNFEIASDVAYKERKIRGFLHLYNGQEAICAGMESELTKEQHDFQSSLSNRPRNFRRYLRLSTDRKEVRTNSRRVVPGRILAGESVSKLHAEYEIQRSVLYRWRAAYRKDGASGLQRAIGRPPGVPNPAPKPRASEEERLRRQVAELERKVGQQALHLDFLQRAFKRVKESGQKTGSTGAAASTKRHGK
jgi:transposase-like protein